MDRTILPHEHGNILQIMHHNTSAKRGAELIADVFRTLSDAIRTQLFWLLCHQEECVVNISAVLGTKSSLTSHHLKILKDAGLVISRREGKEVYYTAANTQKAKILHETIERISELECPQKEPPVDMDSYDSNVHIITKVHELIKSDLRKRYTIEELATRFSVNKTTLKMTFKAYYKRPIASYMRGLRMELAKKLLEETDKNLSEISTEVGYENPSKFTAAFKSETGMLPSKYRNVVFTTKKQSK